MDNKEIKYKGEYNFSKIDYDILYKITKLSFEDRENKFDEWFNYDYKINEDEEFFLKELIKKESKYIQYYLEQQLAARFIIPLLRKVDFATKNYRDWYQYDFSGVVNGYKLSGKPDFMVATGDIKPRIPYFFFQEFKKSRTNSNPDFQVLMEMAVALEKNKTNLIRGVYNIGKMWNFIILEKTPDKKYKYYESETLNCIEIEDLKQIYINLKAIKHKYCK